MENRKEDEIMKIKSKKWISFGVIALAIVVVISGLAVWNSTKANEPKPHLTEAQIAELREQYPIYGIKVPPLVERGKEATLEEAIERAESFVYGEVIGDYTIYYKNISTGHEELDAKRKANGISDLEEFYEYTITVLDDTEGLFTKGEQITIASNTMFMEYKPSLSDGMQVVVPVIQSREKESRYGYGVEGTFYITEDGYAIAAFDEARRAKRVYSGITLEELFEVLKK
jgi:hypothetical protein